MTIQPDPRLGALNRERPAQHMALSVRQPWAAFIAAGEKTLEVRTWHTAYRGPLVICASSNVERAFITDTMGDFFTQTSVVTCVVNLVDIRPGTKRDTHAAMCDPSGYFVWVLERPIIMPPLPIKGRLNTYLLDSETSAQINQELDRVDVRVLKATKRRARRTQAA